MSSREPAWVNGWLELGRRLRAASPEDFDEVSELVRDIIEAEEVMSSHDHLLPLRERRPMKRYSA
jgi:hypothetical protein